MIRIITAIGNPIIIEKLSLYKEINILNEDIQYKDAILEIISKNDKIDFLIFNENLPGEIDKEELIKKIKKISSEISIIYINLQEQKDNEKIFLKKKKEEEHQKIVDIILNKLGIKEITKNEVIKRESSFSSNNIYINLPKNNTFILKRIKDIKGKLLQINVKKYLKKHVKKGRKKHKKNEKNYKVVIVGNSGVGKTIVLLNLAYFLSYRKRNVLIYDFKLKNSDIRILSEAKSINNVEKDKVYITQKEYEINKRIKLKEIDIKQTKNCVEESDFIFYELQNEIDYDIKKQILEDCKKIILIVEPNLIGIKKAKNILDYYEKIFKIKKEKINIVINKKNKFSINNKIIKNIFIYYNIIGKIKYNNKLNYYINKKYKKIYLNKNIKKEYNKILNKI